MCRTHRRNSCFLFSPNCNSRVCCYSNDTWHESNEYDRKNRNQPLDININANINQDADANANGGDGGNGILLGVGGDGGNGGSADITQDATIDVENVIIIPNGPGGLARNVNLRSNGRNLEINSDPNGNVFVNGQRLYEQDLGDGTKVLIYRNNETKKRNT